MISSIFLRLSTAHARCNAPGGFGSDRRGGALTLLPACLSFVEGVLDSHCNLFQGKNGGGSVHLPRGQDSHGDDGASKKELGDAVAIVSYDKKNGPLLKIKARARVRKK